MSPELQWLIYILIENEIISNEDCLSLLEKMGEDAGFEAFAQEAYNAVSEQLSEEEAKSMLDSFEEAIELAAQMAEKGEEVPADFTETLNRGKDVTEGGGRDKENAEDINEVLLSLINYSIENSASDLYLSPNNPPFMRVAGKIEYLNDNPLTPEDSYHFNTVLLSEEQKKHLKENNEITATLQIGGVKIRSNIITHKEGITGSYHLINDNITKLPELGFSETSIETIEKMLNYYNGIIFVTGPKNSGKTTTIAALIDILRNKKEDCINVFEDPAEGIFSSTSECNIIQKEKGTHIETYLAGIRQSYNEDTGILIIDEIDSKETAEYIINAAENGRFVIATLTTYDSINSLNRFVNLFPENKQSLIYQKIARILRGVISQMLLPNLTDSITLGYEILVNTVPVSNNIFEGKLYLLKPAMEVGKKNGMVIMDDCIYELYREGTIAAEVALKNLYNRKQYEKMISSTNL
ncbi:MAG: Flp pilus assembly complex ATPase component TadA [Victivallales bacterium]|nr:Flp pilus assembly complex ATPase component TadA [Victivallales bacterium]MCF7889555.1 Flp pilus assembly complex ATPase component TadA [Victivallales bacterium]